MLWPAQGHYAATCHGRKLLPATFVVKSVGPVEPNVYRAFDLGRPKMPDAGPSPEVVDLSLQLYGARCRADGAIEVIEENLMADSEEPRGCNRLLDAEGAVWGNLLCKDGETFVTLQRALRRDGRIFGYIATEISTTELSRVTDETSELLSSSLDDGSDSFLAKACILYDPNKVLAHLNLISDNSLQSQEQPTVGIRDAGDIVLDALWEGTRIPEFKIAAASDVNVVDIKLAGSDKEFEYVAIYKWLDAMAKFPGQSACGRKRPI